VVATPVRVEGGLKEPQAELEQVTVQVTPAFLVSLVTTAVRGLVDPAARDVGGAGVRETEIDGAVMLMVAVADAAVPEEVVAVMVTEVGVAGAV
jgi:hypothetical protein